ncbi:MAG: helix-turn-helix domain-containing protein [Bacteroidota bacterium]|nr:helix-turn-helix domain-containing protein [Bacteroidota bacterium]
MQHIEFFHIDHFEQNYHRVPPPVSLAHLIDFFWETKFDHLWKKYPKGFSDAQFPNIGYTYIINLGTPFVMQVDDKKFTLKTDCFLPRDNAIECFHKPGNHLFGIKFRIAPVILQKKINFSEYKEYIFPLSYLLDPHVSDNIKKVKTFEERVALLSRHFSSVVTKYEDPTGAVNIVSTILDHCFQQNDFTISINKEAAKNNISERTLQRYFETCTGSSSKKALQVMRIRKATAHLASSPENFHYSLYGYYDHSHFYKHLKQFLQKNTLKNLQPHLQLLENLHRMNGR